MDKIVYLAVAGSGKTYNLCNRIKKDKRNLIIAFTHQNLNNIRRELINKYKLIPGNTDIVTFHSFIYNDFLKPYEYVVWERYTNNEKIKTKGITLKNPPEFIYKRYNPHYVTDEKIGHYIDSLTHKYYCSRISKLIHKCGKRGILYKGIKRLENFYDSIYVDEFQDFRKQDYEVLNDIIKGVKVPCYLYGDFFQHSVSGVNNSGKPFKDKTYENFIKDLKNKGFIVNTTDLLKSRRCPESICEVVRNHLNIEIYSTKCNEGKINVVDDYDNILEILLDNNIVKLFYNNSKKQVCNGINWGYSKGDTYPKTCIIIPKDFNLTEINRNKLYVALTRSKGDVYIVYKNDYDKCI